MKVEDLSKEQIRERCEETPLQTARRVGEEFLKTDPVMMAIARQQELDAEGEGMPHIPITRWDKVKGRLVGNF